MSNQLAHNDFFRKTIFILGILAGLGLFGYALLNLIRMPAVSPDAFVPKSLAPAQPEGFIFGLVQAIFILLYSFAFLPVSIMFTIKKYGENPYALVFGCSLLCLSLLIEIINNLPIMGTYVYPEPLTQISPEVMLYLNQAASIRYLAFDVAGFTIFYTAMLVYAVHYWRSKRFLSWMVITSVITFAASVPFLWVSGSAAVALMALSVFCVSPLPAFFGNWATTE